MVIFVYLIFFLLVVFFVVSLQLMKDFKRIAGEKIKLQQETNELLRQLLEKTANKNSID